jgi:iron(III) transport system substrate-binding protein
MKQRGLLKPYDSPAAHTVAANLRDPDNYWVADRLTQAVIQYNTTLVAGADIPRHWKDLTDARFQGKLTYFSSSNGDGAPRLYTLAKAFGWELLEGFAKTGPLRVQTPQLITQALENGERAVGFAQNDNIALRSKQQGKPTDYLFPDEGVPTEPGAVGLIQNASHPNAAMLFYDWWMGDEGQKLLVDGGKYSSRSDLPAPTGNPPLNDLKLLVLDYNEFQQQRPQILKRMAEVFGGTWG